MQEDIIYNQPWFVVCRMAREELSVKNNAERLITHHHWGALHWHWHWHLTEIIAITVTTAITTPIRIGRYVRRMH
jgi:hypothetical protein